MRDEIRLALLAAAVDLNMSARLIDEESMDLFDSSNRILVTAEAEELLLHVPQRSSWLGTRLAATLNADLPDTRVRFVSRADVWS